MGRVRRLLTVLSVSILAAGCGVREEGVAQEKQANQNPAMAPVAAPKAAPTAAPSANEPWATVGVPVPSGAKLETTASGLQYVDLTVGDGKPASPGKIAYVHYTGWLLNGKKFDSSKDRGEPFNFPVGAGRVIKGWDEGVATMKIGGRRKLIIPANLGYGARDVGNGLIPANSTLIFEVELLRVD